MNFESRIIPINASEDDGLNINKSKEKYHLMFTQLPYANYIGDPYYVVHGKTSDIIKFISEEYDPSASINEFPSFILEL